MLQYSEVSGWLALYIAIVHYKESSVENAIAAARGYYVIKLEKEKITQEKINIIHSRGIGNLSKLERELKLDRRIIINIANSKHINEFDRGKNTKSCFIIKESNREECIRKFNAKARRYWDTFCVGQNVISVTRVARTNVVVRGEVVMKKLDYLSVCQNGRIYSINFSDLISGMTKIKHTCI